MTINLATNYNVKCSEAQDANKLLTSCQDREWRSSRELCKLYRSTRLRGIGHFQVVLNLCFKARLSVKPLIWKWFLFQLVQKKLIITRKVLHLKPRFESESFWNSQMAYSKCNLVPRAFPSKNGWLQPTHFFKGKAGDEVALSEGQITPQGQWGHARWHNCIWRVNRLLEPQFTPYGWILQAFYSLSYLWSFMGLNKRKIEKMMKGGVSLFQFWVDKVNWILAGLRS